MHESLLGRLATQGIDDLDSVVTLSHWCWDRSEATGDARFCSLARLLSSVASKWDDSGALPYNILEQLNQLLMADLPSVLAEPDPEAASLLARSLREDAARVLASPE